MGQLADCERRLASLAADRDQVDAASFRRRERLLEEIARAKASSKATEKELRQARAQLERAKGTLGFRVEVATRRRLRATFEATRGPIRRTIGSIRLARDPSREGSDSAILPGSADQDRERALGLALVSALPASPSHMDSSVTVVLRWSGDLSRLGVAMRRLAETSWLGLDIRIVGTSIAVEGSLPDELGDRAALVQGRDLDDSIRLALEGVRSDFVLFLDDGIEPLESGWLARLVDGAERSGSGASGARLVFGGSRWGSRLGRDAGDASGLSHVGSMLRMIDGLPQASHPPRGADPLDPQFAADRRVAAVDGGCLLIRRRALDDVGPVLGVDLEGTATGLGLRLFQHGWTVQYVGTAVAWDRRPARPSTDQADDYAGGSDPAATFRAVMIDRLSGSFTLANDRVRVALLGTPRSGTATIHDVQARLEAIGLDAVALDAVALGLVDSAADFDPAVEVVLLLEPLADIGTLPRHVITVGWVGVQAEEWTNLPRFADLDIVLVADDVTRARVEAHSVKAAWVAADPATAPGARDFSVALRRWVTARRVAIHIGPVTWEAAASWGDTPFGRDVQKGFERRGWPATVHVHAERDSAPAVRADLALHIFGVRAPAVRPRQVSMLWIISHPDFIDRDLCPPYDIVGVASDRFLEFLRGWLGPAAPPLISLHQATDVDRFYPEPGGPAHELLFVGSSRKVRRPITEALAGTTHDLAVYGRNWTPDLLDPRHLRGEWVSNDNLRRHYSSAAIVLSDSWSDMRDEGFIANRVYDALASGAFVISEAVPGLDEEFDGAVVAFHDREGLRDLIEFYLDHPEERARLAEDGRRSIIARHTFGHRVDAILAAVEPLLAAHGRSTGPPSDATEASGSEHRRP